MNLSVYLTHSMLTHLFCAQGWIRANRPMKKYVFVDVNDGSTHENLQIVLDKSMKPKESSIAYGASISVSGELSQTPKGQLEIHAKEIQLVGNIIKSISLNIHLNCAFSRPLSECIRGVSICSRSKTPTRLRA